MRRRSWAARSGENRAAGEKCGLDVCREHGFWFDTGEFDQLRRQSAGTGRSGLQSRKRSAFHSGRREGREVRERKGFVNTIGRLRRRLAVRRRGRARRQERYLPVLAPIAPAPRPCPSCGSDMTTETWKDLFRATPPVIVDLCPDHGLWLDHGELETLLDRARKDARRTSRSKVSRSRRRGYDRGVSGGLQ